MAAAEPVQLPGMGPVRPGIRLRDKDRWRLPILPGRPLFSDLRDILGRSVGVTKQRDGSAGENVGCGCH